MNNGASYARAATVSTEEILGFQSVMWVWALFWPDAAIRVAVTMCDPFCLAIRYARVR